MRFSTSSSSAVPPQTSLLFATGYLPPNEVDAEGVFEAMRRLLETEPAVNEPSQPDLAELLSWTARDAEGQTADPAQWHDWLRVLAALRDRPEGP